jgi:polar amino acid transport system substrate-binding protein
MIAAALTVSVLAAAPADARPLQQVKESGALALCANPNALPFSAKNGDRHGFQVETAAAVAHELGVGLAQDWVVTAIDRGRADCDVVMDAIADSEVQSDSGLKLSKPYRRSGVALAVRADNKAIAALADVTGDMKIGVLPGSLAAKLLIQRRFHVYPDIFEDELLDLAASGEIAAAAVSSVSIGYYNVSHPEHPMRLVDAFAHEPDLAWNVAVGMVKPDPALTEAVNSALDRLLADGTIKRIYAGYGVELLPPQ